MSDRLDDHEAELLTLARAGDIAAWSTICRNHAPRLSAYLGARIRRPGIVDQLVIEAMVGAWRHLDELPAGTDFGAWFRKLAAGIALRWARERPGEALQEPFPQARMLDASQDERLSLLQLDRVIGELDEPSRMAIELRWRAGMSGLELGAALRTTPDEAERLADEAEVRLERELEERG
ncbi:MAG: sigma-70 family RNA polymerase sigma factor [Planctomycetota bacterium]